MCKVALCDAFRNRKPGPDIGCHVIKSLRKTQLEKLVSKAKVSWPWGKVVCTADVKVKRETIITSRRYHSYKRMVTSFLWNPTYLC